MKIHIFVLFFFALLATVIAQDNIYDLSEEEASFYFKWEIDGESVIITDYHGPREVIIPSRIGGLNVRRIDGMAFFMKNINSVIIPNTVTSIGRSAFTWNNLIEITIPDSVRTIGSAAFSNNELRNITLGNGLVQISDNVFRQNSVIEIIIPDNIRRIEHDGFNQMNSITGSSNRPIPWIITKITIGENVEIQRNALPESFVEFYNFNNKKNGVYELNEDWEWVYRNN
jgi:hypothetical protein